MIYRELGKGIFNTEIADGIYKTVFESPEISSSSMQLFIFLSWQLSKEKIDNVKMICFINNFSY